MEARAATLWPQEESPVDMEAMIAEGRLPPRPGLSKFMMNAGFIFRPDKFLEDAWRKRGDYFTLRPGGDRIIVVTVDPAAVERVFKGDPDLLHAGEANVILEPILGSRSVLLLDGGEHLRHRRMMLPPFHGERMRGYGELMAEVAERHVAGWPRGRRFEVLPSTQAITLEVIMRAVLGIEDPEHLERVGPPLRRILDAVASPRRMLALTVFGERGGRLSPWQRFMKMREEADAVIYEEIRTRRAEPSAADGEDIFSMLLAARDEEGNDLSDDELRDELMTLLVAGHETTATALAWTLERLSRHPEVLDRLTGASSNGDGDDYTDAVVKESLRLRPVIPAVARRLKEDMEFGGYDLPAGVHIAPNIYLLHRRPDLYPEPEAFRPERFLGDDAPGPYEWIPVGGGIRRCLGASFAQYEMRVVLRTILEQVRLRPATGEPERITRRAITLAPSKGARIAVE
jgi:cytochrome P450